MIYLLHFDRKLSHAQHYLGFTDNLAERIERHTAGQGSKLVEAFLAEGIGFTLARTWEGDRHFERKLHKRKSSPQLCPICRAARVRCAQ